MKTTLSLIFFCFISLQIIARNSDSLAFNAGKIIMSIGYGYGSIERALYAADYQKQSNMSFKKSGYGPFHIRGEYSLSDNIGINISINYDYYEGTLAKLKFYGSTEYWAYKNQIYSLSVLMRFNYHFAATKKLDPFFSIGAGGRGWFDVFTTDDPYGTRSYYRTLVGIETLEPTPVPYGFEAVAGMRYYYSNKISLYSEIGIAKSILQIGMSIKL